MIKYVTLDENDFITGFGLAADDAQLELVRAHYNSIVTVPVDTEVEQGRRWSHAQSRMTRAAPKRFTTPEQLTAEKDMKRMASMPTFDDFIAAYEAERKGDASLMNAYYAKRRKLSK